MNPPEAKLQTAHNTNGRAHHIYTYLGNPKNNNSKLL